MKTLIKLFFIIIMMSSSLGFGQVIKDIPLAQKKPTAKEQMNGWSTIFDWGSEKWLVWKAETPILESRAYKKSRILYSEDPFTGKCDYLEYNAGSFYLMENSIIITNHIYHLPFTGSSYASSTGGYFYYDYDGQNYRKKKWVNFAKYQNYTHMCYNNENDVVEWLKRELKNNNANYAPVKLVIDGIITYDLYPYSDKIITDANGFLYSMPDYFIQTDKLDTYPSPTNSINSIKEYMEFIVSNHGFFVGKKVYDIENIYIEFVIDKNGLVKNLTIDGGSVEHYDSGRETSFDPDFNNWLADIINSIKFNPGIIVSKNINTYCEFRITYKPDAKKYKFGNDSYVMYKNGKYGLVDKNANVLIDFIYDDIIINNNYLEVVKNGKRGVVLDNSYKKPKLYDDIIKFDEKCWKVADDGLYGIINQTGEIIPIAYDKIDKINIDDYIFYEAVSGIRHTLYNCNWDVVLEYNFSFNESIKVFDFDKKIWKKQNIKSKKYGLINKNGNTIIPCEYDVIQKFPVKDNKKNDIVYFKKGNKHGLIKCNKLSEPKIWFKDIDVSNKWTRLTYDGYDYLFWIKFDDQENWGLVRINSNGSYDIVIDPEFDEIIEYNIVRKGKKKYQIDIDTNGKIKKTKVK